MAETRFVFVLDNSTLEKLEWLSHENDISKGSLVRWLICAEFLRQKALVNQTKANPIPIVNLGNQELELDYEPVRQ